MKRPFNSCVITFKIRFAAAYLLKSSGIGAFVLLTALTASAQPALPLADLSSFKEPGASWQLAEDVLADVNENNVFTIKEGTGLLVNRPDKKNKGADLYTVLEHGDLDLELDYMMARGANSGIYLQGRYEIQLMDSWGVANPKAGDNGGIYQRWDDTKPEGQKGYEGYAPRYNVSKAPGLWQHLKISFQAPRFDASGKKTENAKILRVELNGMVIHEGITLSGPTRGAISDAEAAVGPLRIQGDHGAVAFKNIRMAKYDKPRPELANLSYKIYKGKFDVAPDYSKLPPEAEGTSVVLTSNIGQYNNEFLIRYTGTLQVKESGEYRFNLSAPGGSGYIKINNQEVVPLNQWGGQGKITLPAGSLPFELVYSKFIDWARPALGLAVAGPGIREYLISDANTIAGEEADPILVNAHSQTLLHSFMDIPNQRITHAVNVGSPAQLHFTYDTERGSLVQVWRGGFLDATPMWHERGDGSSRPAGSVQRFGRPVHFLQTLAAPQAAWSTDSAGTGYRPKGYRLDEMDRPVFQYQIYGAAVSDDIQVIDKGQGVKRTITIHNPVPHLYAQIIAARTIEAIAGNLYMVDDKAFYIRIEDAGGAKPFVRESAGQKELLVPVFGKIIYSILL